MDEETQPDADSGFLPYHGKGYSRYGCICKAQKCKELTKLFRSKRDVRGVMWSLASTKDDTQKTTTEPLKEKKAKLARRHLKSSAADSQTMDKRNQSKQGSPVTTRAFSTGAKEHRCHVAVHHFHPRAIAYSYKNKKYRWLDTLPADWVRSNIQQTGSGDGGYSKNDKFSADKYYVVPSYTMTQAEEDYRLLEGVASIRATVTEVTTTHVTRRTNASAGSSGSSSRRSSGSTSNSSKRNSNGSTSTISSRDSMGSATSDFSIDQYQEAIRFMKAREDQLQSRNTELQDTLNSSTVTEENEDLFLESDLGLKGKYGGLNRLSITSDAYHASNPKISKELFGFDDWEYTKDFINAMFWLEHEEPTASRVNARLTEFEQCLIALIFLETAYSQLTIAAFFGLKSHRQVSACINLWVPEWGEVGEHLSILPFIDAAFLEKTEPQSYIDLNLRKVGAIVDGKDFYTETVRKDRVISAAQQGNKLGKASFRILTWSTPTGLVFEHTKSVFARTTEKKLNDLWAKHGRLKIPVGYLISGDKGFEGTSGMYPNNNTVIHPAFLHGDAKFSISKIGWNHRACQLRYTCETVYSRVTNRATLYGFIRRNHFHLFEHACAWGHGRANLYLPLQMPKGGEAYFGITLRHRANRKRKRSAEA